MADRITLPRKLTLTLPEVSNGARRMMAPLLLLMSVAPAPPLTSSAAFEATLKAAYARLVRKHLPDQAEKLCKKAIGNAFQINKNPRRP